MKHLEVNLNLCLFLIVYSKTPQVLSGLLQKHISNLSSFYFSGPILIQAAIITPLDYCFAFNWSPCFHLWVSLIHSPHHSEKREEKARKIKCLRPSCFQKKQTKSLFNYEKHCYFCILLSWLVFNVVGIIKNKTTTTTKHSIFQSEKNLYLQNLGWGGTSPNICLTKKIGLYFISVRPDILYCFLSMFFQKPCRGKRSKPSFIYLLFINSVYTCF